MNDETIKIQVGDTIDRNTPDYMSCIAMLEQAEHTADRIRTTVKPSLFTERYFTSAEVMRYLHISRLPCRITAITGKYLIPLLEEYCYTPKPN